MQGSLTPRTSWNFTSRDCLESPDGHQTGATEANIEGQGDRIFALQASDLASLTPLQPTFQTVSLERLSGKYSARVMVAYAVRHGEHHLPHGFVRRRMALHQSASARTHGTRTSQASQLKSDPRRPLLRPEERLPLAVATEGLSALEDPLDSLYANGKKVGEGLPVRWGRRNGSRPPRR